MKAIAGSRLGCLHQIGLDVTIDEFAQRLGFFKLFLQAIRLNFETCAGDLHERTRGHAFGAQ
jgi:hypothetical protein